MDPFSSSPDLLKITSAIQDFRRARSQAFLKGLIARITGNSNELLSYEEVRKKLKAYASSDRGLHDIPLDAIVGSVGRYNDFTRDFLPRLDATQDRWSRVRIAAEDLGGLPPIDVYKIGEVYFVQDGNHRVSVARRLGAKSILAYVIEVRTRVPLTPDTKPDDLILKAEYARFLDLTHLDDLRPGADLSVTVPGQYTVLEQHITVHRHYMGLEQQRFIPEDEATAHWFDTVYTPVTEAIRKDGVLRNFPGRTETDLYLWIAEHRQMLENEWGVEIRTEVAALDLLKKEGKESEPVISRIRDILLDTIALGPRESGPPPGQWREEVQSIHPDERLFIDILVPVSGESNSWFALDQAALIAQREGARLHGLHIMLDSMESKEADTEKFQGEFVRRCQEQNVQGHLIISTGEVAREISSQARLTDLVVVTLLHPPPSQLVRRLDSGFRELIMLCPRPVLAVPQVVSPLQHALLAYDGSPKADEALFVAAYLAGTWKIRLTVLTIFEGNRVAPETLLRAKMYLEEKSIEAQFVSRDGAIAETILAEADTAQADLIVMGGYGFNPLLNVILGSAVDQVLRESSKPVLICR